MVMQFMNLLRFKIIPVMFLSGQHGEMVKTGTVVLIDLSVSDSQRTQR